MSSLSNLIRRHLPPWKNMSYGLAALVLALTAQGAIAQHALASDGSSGHELLLEPGIQLDRAQPWDLSPTRANVTVGPVTGCVVRVAYIIPSNRTAQSNAVTNLRWALRQYQDWYREQMERYGFGPRTFRYETEPDGVTPTVYVVSVAETDAFLRGDLWARTLNAATSAGIPVWGTRQVWWVIPEAHLMAPNGSISGGTALGASFGSGDDPGVGMIGGDALARFAVDYLTNNTSYANKIIPEIGPYPLVLNVSFPSFENTTLSSVSSSVLGAALHELSHGLGLPHDFRNDQNFNGNLMGNGLRGFRGNLFPERYASDRTRAAYGSALALSVSRYFNPPRVYADNTKPALSVSTSGAVTITNGLLQINFTASDASGLYAAWLQLNGDLVDEMPLQGNTTNTGFNTAHYNPGQNNTFNITVFDTQGNRQSVERTIVPGTGMNRAPQPYVKVPMPSVIAGQAITLDASASTDPGGNTSLMQVEWDLDGDGVFDTAPTTSKQRVHRFYDFGDRLIRARLTDSEGAKTVSAPVPLRVLAPQLAISRLVDTFELSWPIQATGFILQSSIDPTAHGWAANLSTPAVSGSTYRVTVTNLSTAEWFRLSPP